MTAAYTSCRVRCHPSTHETSTQCSFSAGPALSTLARHWVDASLVLPYRLVIVLYGDKSCEMRHVPSNCICLSAIRHRITGIMFGQFLLVSAQNYINVRGQLTEWRWPFFVPCCITETKSLIATA